jgi:hypothetical protein
VPSAATPIALVFLAAILSMGLIAAVRTRRADWWLATLVIVLAMFPNSSIIQSLRETGGGFSLFVRYVGGVLSLIDVLLLVLLALAFFVGRRRESMVVTAGKRTDAYLVGLSVIWGMSVFNGLLHATVVPYGPTNFRSVIQGSLPLFYVLCSLAIARLAMHDRWSVWKIVWALRVSTAAVLVQGTILLGLSLAGRFPAMSGISGIPIVLYDQLSIAALAVSLAVARSAVGIKAKPGDWVMAAGSVFFLVTSTRRLVMLFLVLNVFLVFLFAVARRHALRSYLRVALNCVALAIVVGTVGYVVLPRFGAALREVVASMSMTSDTGRRYAGDLRIAEWQNLVRNLGEGATSGWVIGRGVGTYWQEFVPLGISTTSGSTAFAEARLEAGARGWWAGFHLSYASLLYRFGVAGSLAIVVLVFGWLFRWHRVIRRLPPPERAFGAMVLVLAAEYLLALGDSPDSYASVLYGVLLAGVSCVPGVRAGRRSVFGSRKAARVLVPDMSPGETREAI